MLIMGKKMTAFARPKDAVPSYAVGGILADAMGLGKTLTMIAVIVLTASHAAQCVADSWRGIPASVRTTLFEPFVSHGKENGTGLGLTVVQKIVQGVPA